MGKEAFPGRLEEWSYPPTDPNGQMVVVGPTESNGQFIRAEKARKGGGGGESAFFSPNKGPENATCQGFVRAEAKKRTYRQGFRRRKKEKSGRSTSEGGKKKNKVRKKWS